MQSNSLQFSHLLNNVGIHNDKKRYVYKDNQQCIDKTGQCNLNLNFDNLLQIEFGQ